MVWLWVAASSWRRAKRASELAWSRLPVGSSARRSGGLVGEGAGDGDALLLASGELVAAAMEFVAEADAAEDFLGPGAGFGFGERSLAKERQEDVFKRSELGEEEVKLKDKADERTPVDGCAPLRQRCRRGCR